VFGVGFGVGLVVWGWVVGGVFWLGGWGVVVGGGWGVFGFWGGVVCFLTSP
jgi:hypothetical protein